MTARPICADITGGTASGTDFAIEVKRCLQADLRDCRWSRADVAEMLGLAAGRSISEYQLDNWTAETKEGHRFPAELVGAWVRVTGSRRLIDLVCGAAGFVAADQTDRDLAEFGRATLREQKAQAEAERLRGELWGRI